MGAAQTRGDSHGKVQVHPRSRPRARRRSRRVPAAAQDIRIGYAISRTGPFAAGAQISQEPNYIMWAEQVNAAGGLTVGGKKRKIELIGYDDRSEVETMVRTYEKLMGSDKVDLILPPWGTGMNFALMPLAQRHRYPMLSPTATGRKLLG
jgi:branched-chain amino acid transport system substrate-binding protein